MNVLTAHLYVYTSHFAFWHHRLVAVSFINYTVIMKKLIRLKEPRDNVWWNWLPVLIFAFHIDFDINRQDERNLVSCKIYTWIPYCIFYQMLPGAIFGSSSDKRLFPQYRNSWNIVVTLHEGHGFLDHRQLDFLRDSLGLQLRWYQRPVLQVLHKYLDEKRYWYYCSTPFIISYKYVQMKINRWITKNIFLCTISWAYFKLEAELIGMCSTIQIISRNGTC